MSDTMSFPPPDGAAAGSASGTGAPNIAPAETIDTPPRCIPAVPLHQRQLTSDLVELQRAAAVAHRHGQRIEGSRLGVAVGLAAAGVVVTAVDAGTGVIAVLGLLWFVSSTTALRGAANRSARTSALLQEQFDTELFYLPWRKSVAGGLVAAHDAAALARKLKRGSVRDKRITDGWYDPVDGVHHPYDVLIAQEQNLVWDIRLRRRYANSVLAGGVLWALVGLVVAYAINAGVADTALGFYVPSLAAFAAAIDIWHGQRKVAAERERLNGLVGDTLSAANPGHPTDDERRRLHELAREIQDGVLRTRMETTRVPEWLYRRYRSRDEEDFARTAEERRSRLVGTRACPHATETP